MTETLCDSGAVKLKAGTRATTLTPAQYTQLINQAEAFINAQSQYDWVANYASLASGAIKILEDATSSYAALSVINYDMSGYTSRTESQVMLDVNWAKVVECVNLLKDSKYREFVRRASTD